MDFSNVSQSSKYFLQLSIITVPLNSVYLVQLQLCGHDNNVPWRHPTAESHNYQSFLPKHNTAWKPKIYRRTLQPYETQLKKKKGYVGLKRISKCYLGETFIEDWEAAVHLHLRQENI